MAGFLRAEPHQHLESENESLLPGHLDLGHLTAQHANHLLDASLDALHADV